MPRQPTPDSPAAPRARLIERVRAVCAGDERLLAAPMYGSFAQGAGDHSSDGYFAADALPRVDRAAWAARVAPAARFLTAAFGVGTAIFADDELGLLRGEFHFDRAAGLSRIDASWREADAFRALDQAVILDRTGEPTRRVAPLVGPPSDRDQPEPLVAVDDRFAGRLLWGSNVLARGECARAHGLLGHVHRHLLWLARLDAGATDHRPTPSRALESDPLAAAYGWFAACTSRLDPVDLARAYRAT